MKYDLRYEKSKLTDFKIQMLKLPLVTELNEILVKKRRILVNLILLGFPKKLDDRISSCFPV